MCVAKISLIVLVSLLSLTTALAAPLADSTCPNKTCKAYLPVITYQPRILLFAPTDGEKVISLAPVLSWRAPLEGIFQIQVSQDPAFAPTSVFPLSQTKELKLPLPDRIDTLIGSNLKARVIYYWRVQITTSKGETFAALGHFTTPTENKHLLPSRVQLLAPANNTTLTGSNALLQWRAVPGAWYYRIRMYDSNNVLFRAGSTEVPGAVTAYNVSGLTSGMTYHWKVKALNAYGWGPYFADFAFKAP
jgi:Fibronectin type III domain